MFQQALFLTFTDIECKSSFMLTLGKMTIDIEKNCRILVSPINEHIISFVPTATPIFYIVNDKSGPKTFIYRNDLGLRTDIWKYI